ncbi:MAG TPA: protein-glutamate O-methyltransferase CheR [Rhodocyclaceae bacterium]|nr:protein-glutamate O-methyltransferase CheR [Rhodocyclaceae bacterium]
MNGLHLSDREFALFQTLMHDMTGVYLAPTKKPMVFSRLSRRLHLLELGSFEAYYRRIAGGDTEELQCAVDLLTTHETYFFREPKHFDYLAEHVLPHARPRQPLRVWSAACSSGEEAYSAAMVLMDKLGASAPWEVVGTDISQAVLARARGGIYGMERLHGLPKDYLRRFCLRGIGDKAGTLLVEPGLRTRVRFAHANLKGDLKGLGEFDVVFLRNVLIYFAPPTKRNVVRRVLQQLKPGGWFFIGHSESLNGLDMPLKPVQPAVYRRLQETT